MVRRRNIISLKHATHFTLTVTTLFLLTGCGLGPVNPSMSVSASEAKQKLKDMHNNPVLPLRPIIVAGGIMDPGFVAPALAKKLRRATHPDARIIAVSFFGTSDFDDCRAKLLDRIDEEFGVDGESIEFEFDVIGFSMGGLVARYAAEEAHDDHRSLNISRLFTIASPHRGAALADWPTFDQRAISMRAGSAFLERLSRAQQSYDLMCYVRLGDTIVGPENAAPEGFTPIWVSNPTLQFAHIHAPQDPRLIADIARHLRNEAPLATYPPAPFPGSMKTTVRPSE